LTNALEAEMNERFSAEITEAFSFAENAPYPDPSTAKALVYA
jgi:TPP-dependent pyruvate/acetoin dehydrogenase alpha subunit